MFSHTISPPFLPLPSHPLTHPLKHTLSPGSTSPPPPPLITLYYILTFSSSYPPSYPLSYPPFLIRKHLPFTNTHTLITPYYLLTISPTLLPGNTSPSNGKHTFGSEKYDDSFCAKTFARNGYSRDVSPSPGQYSPPNTQSHFFHGRSLHASGGMGGTGGTSVDGSGLYMGAGGGGYGSSYGSRGTGTGVGMGGVVGGLGLHLNTDIEYDMRAYVDGAGTSHYNGNKKLTVFIPLTKPIS